MKVFRWRDDRKDIAVNLGGCNFIFEITEALDLANKIYQVRNEMEWPLHEKLDFRPGDRFSFRDDPDEHDPCYVDMPGGACIPLNHHAGPGVDINRAKWIIETLNKELDRLERESA